MNFACWASGTWAAGTWVIGSWCPGPEVDTGGYIAMLAPVRRLAVDEEDELLAWFFLEVMDG
jgi:hypothetical protein